MGTSYAIKTDIGTRKMQNQDAYGLRVACNGFHEIVFAVVCDGVGGMSCGEVASNTVVHTFLQWFDQKVPELFTQQISLLLTLVGTLAPSTTFRNVHSILAASCRVRGLSGEKVVPEVPLISFRL